MKELMRIRIVENAAGGVDLLIDPDNVTGQDFDQLLYSIAQVRPQIQPPVQTELPSNMSQIEVVPTPGWFVGGTFELGTILSIRHPAFGWLAFQLTDQIRNDLMRALESAPSGPSLPPPASRH